MKLSTRVHPIPARSGAIILHHELPTRMVQQVDFRCTIMTFRKDEHDQQREVIKNVETADGLDASRRNDNDISGFTDRAAVIRARARGCFH